MRRPILVSIAAAMLTITAATQADAWGRSWSFAGPRGATYSRSRECSGGSCSWNASGTRANGRSWSRSGSANCSGDTCSISGQGVGSAGRSYSYSGSVTR